MGMPTIPPIRNGVSRCISICLRSGQSVVRCSNVPQAVIKIAECSGSIRCSQIDDEARPNAKPLAPAAMPPSNPPSHKNPRVSMGMPAIMRSNRVQDESKPHRENRGEANGKDRERLFAKIKKFDREQPET